jgi:hypothetical protein
LQFAQTGPAIGLPHEAQNLEPGWFAALQLGQAIVGADAGADVPACPAACCIA